MISVEDARARLFAAARVLPVETVDLADGAGRTLVAPIRATRNQPPFAASAMDGYALRSVDGAGPLNVIGESAAGHRFCGTLGAGEAVRIFTGAPVPAEADTVVIQEDVVREGTTITLAQAALPGANIRARGLDIRQGENVLDAGTCLAPRHLALAGAAGHATLQVSRRPVVAFLATGDELKAPGTETGPDDIVASVTPTLAAMVREAGAVAIDLGIVPDEREAIAAAARDGLSRADILVTLGGASVGDHDLVRPVLADLGVALDFWRVAVRPGKPLMFAPHPLVLGLPGNPVSGVVCTLLFLVPLLKRMQGNPSPGPHSKSAVLGASVRANGPRADHMRAQTDASGQVVPFEVQDSSMLSVLATADCLLIRPPKAAPAQAGDPCQVYPL